MSLVITHVYVSSLQSHPCVDMKIVFNHVGQRYTLMVVSAVLARVWVNVHERGTSAH